MSEINFRNIELDLTSVLKTELISTDNKIFTLLSHNKNSNEVVVKKQDGTIVKSKLSLTLELAQSPEETSAIKNLYSYLCLGSKKILT